MTVSITENSKALEFHLIDVFTPEPLSGNGLSVFLLDSHAELTVTIGGEVRIVGNGMLNLSEGFI